MCTRAGGGGRGREACRPVGRREEAREHALMLYRCNTNTAFERAAATSHGTAGRNKTRVGSLCDSTVNPFEAQ